MRSPNHSMPLVAVRRACNSLARGTKSHGWDRRRAIRLRQIIYVLPVPWASRSAKACPPHEMNICAADLLIHRVLGMPRQLR